MKTWKLACTVAVASAMTLATVAPASATPTSVVANVASTSTEVTPRAAMDYYMEPADLLAEGQRQGLSSTQMELASKWQNSLNLGLRSMPIALRTQPLSHPEVAAHLTDVLNSGRGGPDRIAAAGIYEALQCVYSLADVLSIAVPGRNVWTLIEIAGSIPALTRAIADVAAGQIPPGSGGRVLYDELSRVLGFADVAQNCGRYY